MKITIKTAIFSIITIGSVPDFPKYTSQLMNWANQNAQGTRPRVVGSSRNSFRSTAKSAATVRKFPSGDGNGGIRKDIRIPSTKAADKIFHQMEHLKEAIQLIDLDMIRRWVYDLVITKTYNGLYIQKAILARLAEEKGTDYRLACPGGRISGNRRICGRDGLFYQAGYLSCEKFSARNDRREDDLLCENQNRSHCRGGGVISNRRNRFFSAVAYLRRLPQGSALFFFLRLSRERIHSCTEYIRPGSRNLCIS